MNDCIKCGIELSLENWYEADKHKKFYICKKCKSKEMREIMRRTSRVRRAKLRQEIIKLLGGKCVKCGESDWRCLQIDHLNRFHGHYYERNHKGSEMYMREVLNLIKNGSNELQLLCANHNWIKRYENNELNPKNRNL